MFLSKNRRARKRALRYESKAMEVQFGLSWQYGDKKGSFAFLHRDFRIGISNWQPALIAVADVLEGHVLSQFQTEGKAETMGWAELAESTIRKRGSAHPILQVTGDLKLSFQRGSSLHVEEITKTSLVWGSAVPHSLFAQFGTGGKVNFRAAGARKTMFKTEKARKTWEEVEARRGQGGGQPARPMLVYSKRLADEITSRIMAHIILIARQTGYRILGRAAETPTEALHAGLAHLGAGRSLARWIEG